ncbi:MAG: winged helix-turn-helix transcriptional regulator [Nitrosopumilaceae archaeon]
MQEIKTMSDQMKCCPVDNTFKIMGKKFTIHILRNMIMLNQTRFNQFLDSVEGINPKTLSVRLREMEKNGLISRKIYPETPIRIEYSVTEKGKALTPILEQMASFSMKYCCDDVFKDGKPRAFKEVFGRPMKTFA